MENSKQPAFAVSKEMCEASEIETYPYGLTKREYFAAKAMQAFASNPDWAKTMRTPDDWDEYKARLATGAVELADAVLSALENKK